MFSIIIMAMFFICIVVSLYLHLTHNIHLLTMIIIFGIMVIGLPLLLGYAADKEPCLTYYMPGECSSPHAIQVDINAHK